MAVFGIVILLMAMFGKRGIAGWLRAVADRFVRKVRAEEAPR